VGGRRDRPPTRGLAKGDLVINLDPSSSTTTTAPANVELLRWPADAGRRDELAAEQRPRLLLVGAGVAPPLLDREEDWIRVPADERDLWSRLQRLAELHDMRRRRPQLSDGVVLDHGGRSVIVSAGEGAVLRPLLDRFGLLVRWDELIGTLWPDGDGTLKLAVARVSRLRIRIAPIGLAVHNIRGRGVLLDHGVPPKDSAPTAATRDQLEEDMWPIW
jgi:DNA-binding winged helix-turn-helix (wHTH) protein